MGGLAASPRRTDDTKPTRERKTDMKLNYEKHGTHENKVIGRPIGLPLNALKPARALADGYAVAPQPFLRTASGSSAHLAGH